MTVLVGGVGELFQGDLDLGRIAAERLQAESLAPEVLVEELHYGAVAVSQRLEELRPRAFLLVGAVRRGRRAGEVERCVVTAPRIDVGQVQAAVGDAVTGYVGIDLIIEVAGAFGTLPRRTVAIEVEPASLAPGEGLSPVAEQGLGRALDLMRAEIERQPLFDLADELRPLVDGDRIKASPGLTQITALLGELTRVHERARWGHTFVLRDRLKRALTTTHSGEGMDATDWALWWALVEELDRLQALEASSSP